MVIKTFPENRRGWIRIVEALVAMLLITGIMVLVAGNSQNNRTQSGEIYDSENYILREIQSNETFRNYALGLSLSSDVEFGDFDMGLKNHIENRIPSYLNCSSKICSLSSKCELSNSEENLYVKSAFISSNPEIYSPRQIKLFCWEI